MPYDYAIHSDYLIHWTGKDIDQTHDPEWASNDKSTTSEKVEKLYLDRLYNILKHGLWMTREDELTFGSSILIPSTPKCCFTELKISQSRQHARQYGRLGIGVKRPFLFKRFGRPLAYFGFKETDSDELLKACAQELSDKNLLNFFKPMNSTRVLNYDLYGESEWRILFFEELLKKKLIIDPRDHNNQEAADYLTELGEKSRKNCRYLIPLDGWLSMIIYPSRRAKVKAQKDDSSPIHQEIKKIKLKKDHGNAVEEGNWPIELNLDACRQF